MATFSALSVVSRAVAALFSDAALPDEFPNADYGVVGAAALEDSSAQGTDPLPALGVTVYPYRVAYNVQRRPSAPRVTPDGERFRASLLLDLHLLISAWASTGFQQMRLLAWAARTIEDTPILTPGQLNRWAPSGQEVFGAAESVELVPEALTLQELVNIWEINKSRQQPSLGYVARMVAVDSQVRIPDAGIVRSRVFNQGVLG